jgi:hypothetical protein
MEDELKLMPGDEIQVIEEFDDGWAFGKHCSATAGGPQEGVFPLACLTTPLVATQPAPIGNLVSSNSFNGHDRRLHLPNPTGSIPAPAPAALSPNALPLPIPNVLPSTTPQANLISFDSLFERRSSLIFENK